LTSTFDLIITSEYEEEKVHNDDDQEENETQDYGEGKEKGDINAESDSNNTKKI
jgi:hypothetical protein